MGTLATYHIAWQANINAHIERKAATLSLQLSNLENHLDKYRLLAPLLARRADIIELIQNRNHNQAVKVSKRIAGMSGAQEVVFTDLNGDFFSSNLPGFSLGSHSRQIFNRNSSAFKSAQQGRLGRDTFISPVDNAVSYLFVAPVRSQQQIIGMVALRLSLNEVEQDWALTSDALAAITPKRIVAITNRSSWRGKPVPKIILSQEENLNTVTLDQLTGPVETVSLASLEKREKGVSQEFLYLSKQLPVLGWQLFILSSIEEVKKQTLRTSVISALLQLLALCLLMYTLDRRWRLLERIEMNSRTAEELEQRVEERTAALFEANQRLEREVTKHKLTESELQQTQAGLIQSAKLATLGEMSAALSHEFSQPLGAIRMHAENALLWQKQNKSDKLEKNLQRVIAMVDRMAAISQTLKGFSRKAGSEIRQVDILPVIDEALLLAGPRLKQQGIELEYQRLSSSIFVNACQVRLTQVLMNLISNAVDAMKFADSPKLTICVTDDTDFTEISIIDNGGGVSPQTASQIFDPFFTTKDVGEGLGLGLAIAYKIMRDMGGSLSYSPSPTGGACFCVRLKKQGHAQELLEI